MTINRQGFQIKIACNIYDTSSREICNNPCWGFSSEIRFFAGAIWSATQIVNGSYKQCKCKLNQVSGDGCKIVHLWSNKKPYEPEIDKTLFLPFKVNQSKCFIKRKFLGIYHFKCSNNCLKLKVFEESGPKFREKNNVHFAGKMYRHIWSQRKKNNATSKNKNEQEQIWSEEEKQNSKKWHFVLFIYNYTHAADDFLLSLFSLRTSFYWTSVFYSRFLLSIEENIWT